jgi:hypothetical protein
MNLYNNFVFNILFIYNMKLLRLSTIDDNAFFAPDFDTDIILKDNASIGLKNALFQVGVNRFVSNGATNGVFTIQPSDSDVAAPLSFQIIEPGNEYTADDPDRLFLEVEKTLNRALNNYASFSGGRHREVSFLSSYRCRRVIGLEDDVVIKYALSNLINPAEKFHFGGNRNVARPYFLTAAAPFNVVRATNKNQRLSVPAANPARVDEAYNFIACNPIEFCKGSGMFYAQIYSSVQQGDAATGNGFGIGLALQSDDNVLTNPRMRDDVMNKNIPDKARNFELLYKDPATPYSFRASGFEVASTAAVSAINPDTTDTPARNDVLVLEMDSSALAETLGQKIIVGSVLQYNGGAGVKREIFRYHLTDSDLQRKVRLTPYIYFKGNENNIVIHNVRFSPDMGMDMRSFGPTGNPPAAVSDKREPSDSGNFFYMDRDHPIGGDVSNTIVKAADVGANLVKADAVIGNLLPPLRSRGGMAGDFGNGVLTFNRELLGFLGTTDKLLSGTKTFTERIATYQAVFYIQIAEVKEGNTGAGAPSLLAGQKGFNIFFRGKSLFEGGDYFIIELQNILLDSYNSSATYTDDSNTIRINRSGTRKNILATIPQDTLRDGNLIIHEPNEVNLIDIRNTGSEVNLRNLRLRILDSELNPILLTNQAELTLLVDG